MQRCNQLLPTGDPSEQEGKQSKFPLSSKNSAGTLTEREQEQLANLGTEARRLTLRKTQAYARNEVERLHPIAQAARTPNTNAYRDEEAMKKHEAHLLPKKWA